MNQRFSLLIFILVSYWYSSTSSAQALPDMTTNQANDWFRQHRSVKPLKPTKKLEADEPDFGSEILVEGGKAHLSIFLDRQGFVESENIDYRPDCYFSTAPSSCRSTIRFEKSTHTGHTLIKTIWGEKVLEDFQASTLVESISSGGTQRWYTGKLYNYTTWHESNYTIVHFTVISKKTSQSEQIRKATYCSKNPRSCMYGM
jgi:hypothetical protein